MSTFRRNPYRVSIWAILAVSGCTPCLAGDWYPGIVHAHTQFSDGVASPEVLATAVRAAGARFLIVTDHYDMIEKQEKWGTPFSLSLMDIAHNRGGPWGFDKYSGGILSLTRDGEFVAIPGAEIGARWEPEPGNEASAHTLALGVFTEADSQVLDEYCEKPGGQQHIIDKIRQWGMLPVAAHPSFLHDGRSGKLSLGGRIDYRYDKRPAVQYKGLAGVEMWNVDASDQHQTDALPPKVRTAVKPLIDRFRLITVGFMQPPEGAERYVQAQLQSGVQAQGRGRASQGRQVGDCDLPRV